MRFNKLIVATHRDLGYFFAGLTVIYAISGICVNHLEHWNPNYSKHTEVLEVGTLPTDAGNEALTAEVLKRLKIETPPKSTVRMSPEELTIFFEGRTLAVSLPGGSIADEHITPRPLLYQLNFLHLNHGKGIWTWFADIYALGLLILALTGIFIIRGKKGLGGRGRWLLLAGLAVPLTFLIFKMW